MNATSSASAAKSSMSPSLRRFMHRRRRPSGSPWIWSFAVCVLLVSSSARAQQTNPSQQPEEPLNTGNDITRPLSRFDLRYNFQDKGGGINQSQFIFRLDHPFQIADTWKIAVRLDMPFVLSNNISSDNPHGKYGFGTGDFLAQATLIKDVSERFAYGGGFRTVFPTANADQFGSGKYELVPFIAFRYSIPELTKGTYFEPIVRYDVDAGGYGGRKHISRLRLDPMFNLDFPGRWFLTLFPSQDIVLNTIGGHKWFVPADFMIGQKINKDTIAAVEISIPMVRQFTLYDFKLEARITHSF